MNDIQQAREWAAEITESRQTNIRPDAFATAEVIQSLPEQWIDAEKLREALEGCDKMTYPYEVIEHIEKTLLTPPLPTLADMTPEERDTQKWMQAKVFPTASTLGIITGVDEYAHSAIILFADGMAKNVPWGHITPLPDAPKLEWPSLSVSDKSEAVSVETEDVTEESRTALPRPEDVPDPQPGEAWLIEYRGKRYEALFWYSELYAHWTFGMGRKGTFTVESPEATPIARLVPEVKP